MTLKTSLITAIVGSALVLGVPAAWGQSQPGTVSSDVVERAVLARELSSKLDAKVYRDAFERAVAANGQGAAVGSYLDAHNRSSGPLSTSAVPADAFERAVQSGRTTGFVGDSHDRITPVSSPSPVSVATSGRDIEWPQIGIGFGIGLLLGLGLFLTMRLTRIRQLAH